MKIIQATKYQSNDGQQFDSVQECAEHEAKQALKSVTPEGPGAEQYMELIWDNIEKVIAIYQTYEKSVSSVRKPRKPSLRRRSTDAVQAPIETAE